MSGAKQAGDLQAVGTLAIRLLAAGIPSGVGPGQVAVAISTARSLMKELEKGSRIHACELFGSSEAMSMEDIAARFKEHRFEKLTATNTVTKRVSEILTALHHDVQRRENLVTAAFRQLATLIDPDDAKRESIRMIRDLLERTRMSVAFDRDCEEVASAVWQLLVERLLMQRQKTFAEIERTRNHTREYFALICTEMRYETFIAQLAPPRDLGADRLLDLIFWLEHRFATLGKTKPLEQSDLDRLDAINSWPDHLFPNASELSRPFAAFLAEYSAGDAVTAEQAERFDDGLRRLSGLERRLRAKELAARLSRSGEAVGYDETSRQQSPAANAISMPEDGLPADHAGAAATFSTISEAPAAGHSADRADQDWERHPGGLVNLANQLLKGLRTEWWSPNEDKRFVVTNASVADPMILVSQVELFLLEGRIPAVCTMVFDGNKIRDPLLRGYAKDLQGFQRCLSELQTLADLLSQPSRVWKRLSDLLEKEVDCWDKFAGELGFAKSPEHEHRIGCGQKTYEDIKCLEGKTIGRIRPHLLFAYARDAGFDEATYSRVESSKDVSAAQTSDLPEAAKKPVKPKPAAKGKTEQ